MVDYTTKLKLLLSKELNCQPSDFDLQNNVVTISELCEGRRMYSPEKYFFHMVTMGRNAVITADECLHGFLKKYAENTTGHRLFEIPNLLLIENELKKYGYTLTTTYHMFLPSEKIEADDKFDVKWFYDKEIHQFYGDERFPNAICESYLPQRPDRIVVCAYDGENIMGMAGCSEDAPHWEQIGIDVIPQYRSMGVGSYLVTLLKNRILENGDIPFYGTSLSNYHSWNIALNSGFRPAWVEIGASKYED